LKKITNPTPYSPISYFGKENTLRATITFTTLYSNLKLPKPLNNLTTLEYPWCNFKKLKLPHMVVSIWLTIKQNTHMNCNFFQNKYLIVSGQEGSFTWHSFMFDFWFIYWPINWTYKQLIPENFNAYVIFSYLFFNKKG
jgi:hypothetical protein